MDNSDGAHPETWPEVAPADYWQERYCAGDRIWSGRVNQTLADVAGGLAPGRALDLGCGEGADAIWLARRGWRTLAVDIAPAAIERARQAAAAEGLDDGQVEFLAVDLGDMSLDRSFDLVTASFLHSPVHLPREAILRQAAGLVAEGGHLLVVAHAAAPPWADASAHEHTFLTVEEELAALGLDDSWETVLAQTRTRTSQGPDGQPATLDDVVVLVRRTGVGAPEPLAT